MPDYATLDELKSYLRIPLDDDTDDGELALAISAASQTIERFCNRTFVVAGVTPTVRYFEPYYNKRTHKMVLPLDDVQDITGLSFSIFDDNDVETVVDASYKLYPRAGFHPYTSAQFEIGGIASNVTEVAVSARWGWDTVPVSIRQATLLQAARLFKRRDAPFGIAGNPEMGSELRLLAKLDPDVELLVGNYKKTWGAV